jgi:hypothetical protein
MYELYVKRKLNISLELFVFGLILKQMYMDKTISVPLKCEFCQSNDIKVMDINAECGQCGKINNLHLIQNIAKEKAYKMAQEYGRQIINNELKKISQKNFKIKIKL